MADERECFRPSSGRGKRWFHLAVAYTHDSPCNEAICGVTSEWGDAECSEWGDAECSEWGSIAGDARCPRCADVAIGAGATATDARGLVAGSNSCTVFNSSSAGTHPAERRIAGVGRLHLSASEEHVLQMRAKRASRRAARKEAVA